MRSRQGIDKENVDQIGLGAIRWRFHVSIARVLH